MFKVYMTDLLSLLDVLISITKKFHFWSGTKRRDQKQETENDCDVISGLQASRITDFSDIFLFSYKQHTIVPFFSELTSSQ